MFLEFVNKTNIIFTFSL